MADRDESSSGRERRRYTRLPIHLEAQIALGPRPPIACVVKDFCVAGMFIQIDMRQLRFVQERAPANLQFALTLNGATANAQLALTVCRVTPNGLGVAFRNPEPKLLGQLHQFALGNDTELHGRLGETISDTQRRFVPEFGRILPRLTEVVERQLSHIAVEFTRVAQDALFIAARDARSNREQTIFVDAQNQLKRKAAEITKAVPETMAKAVAIINNPLQTHGASDSQQGSSGLSLVDKEEFEEFLVVSELVAELEGRYKEPLWELNRRFSFLSRREVTDRTNPIAPTVICNAFAESLKGGITELAANGIVYQALRRLLDANIERLYQDVNALLIENNILPQLEKEKFEVKKTAEDSRQPTRPPTPLEASKHGVGVTAPPATEDVLSRTQSGIWQHSSARAQRQASARTAPPRLPGGRTNPPYPGSDTDPAAWARTTGQPGYGGFSPGFGEPLAAGGGARGTGAPPNAGGGANAFGFDATFSGFGFGPAVNSGPSFERALSVARGQMALRRQIAPSGAPIVSDPRKLLSSTQVLDGLSELQRRFTGTADPDFLQAEKLKEQIAEALRARGIDDKTFSQTESDVVEIIVNLFQSLLQDAQVSENAKSNLKRMQPSVHRAAMVDQEFFASTQHPLRQLMNRISLVRTEQDERGKQVQSRVREIVDHVNLAYDRDASVVDPYVAELDDVIKQQRSRYEENIQSLIVGCEDQQRILRDRRDRSGEAPPPSPPPPPELSRWITRAKTLQVGDAVLMNANTKTPLPCSLVWIGDDFNPFVLADQRGVKAASLTLQQVAMYLRRGLLKVLTQDDNAVDRALFGVVNRLHQEVVEEATHDTLTGLLNRKSLLNAIESQLTQNKLTDAVLCQLSIENLKTVNEQHGVAAGDQLVKKISDALRAATDKKNALLGRLGGTEWGILWLRGGLQSAYKETQTLLESLQSLEATAGSTVQPKMVAGLAAVDADGVYIDALITAVNEACVSARARADTPIYVAGTDTKQRKQLEQMMAYVTKAVDRGRLALLFHEVRALGRELPPAAHITVSAEDRNGKLVPPALFAQAAANTAQAFDVDLWTLKSTLRWMASHSEECERFSAFVIPLSRAALDKEELANLVVNELMETSVPPARVCFEIDDKTAISKLTETSDFINTLREFGCQFILSEFGSGQVDYAYLKELAVDFVSLPSGYIADGRQDPKDLAIVKSINEFAHFLGKLTIGKLQSDAGGLEFLRELKMDFVHDVTRATRLLLESDERTA